MLQPEVLRNDLPHPGALLLHSLSDPSPPHMCGWLVMPALTGLGPEYGVALFSGACRCKLLHFWQGGCALYADVCYSFQMYV